MRELGDRFTRMGDIALIKRGITSGYDAFFMPRDVSLDLLADNATEIEWSHLPLIRRCRRADVESGDVVIIQCGDKTLHPIEAKYVRPEVHSLMQVDRPVVHPKQLNRVVLWVNEELPKLKRTYAHDFIVWGSKQTFASTKSKSVPVPQRESCASRELWYDVTGLQPGIGFWPMAQQYRHIIPENPHRLVCNHNLFDIHPLSLDEEARRALMPILNSTIVAFVKAFYGRYAGTEGNLKTEVVDALLIEIPDPRNVTSNLLKKLEYSFASMQEREITHLVEQAFLNCHTASEVLEAARRPLGLPAELQQPDRRELDGAVFELLGITNAKRRGELIDQLYREVALHHRNIRIVEVQKMEQRRSGGATKVSVMNLALSAWDELDSELQKPLSKWLEERADGAKIISLPDGEVRLPEATNFFDATTVYFGKNPPISHVCSTRIEAELIADIARTGLRGPVSVPMNPRACEQVSAQLRKRLDEASSRFEELAQQYAGSDKLREQLVDLLQRWFIEGKPTS